MNEWMIKTGIYVQEKMRGFVFLCIAVLIMECIVNASCVRISPTETYGDERKVVRCDLAS